MSSGLVVARFLPNVPVLYFLAVDGFFWGSNKIKRYDLSIFHGIGNLILMGYDLPYILAHINPY